MNGTSALELGATLYVPALRGDSAQLAHGSLAGLRSIVICLEDSVREDEVDRAMRELERTLLRFVSRPPEIKVYVRPRNTAMLAWICSLPGVGLIEGFVLPKVTTTNLPAWLNAMSHDGYAIMPTIEGEEAFYRPILAKLRDQLTPHKHRIPAVRIGGNDILGLLGVRRSRTHSAYEGPLGTVIRDIAAVFIPRGFNVAAPVFEHYTALDVLRVEVERDIEHGLLTKSAIHPSQIPVIQQAYRPSATEIIEARRILDVSTPAVYGSEGSMCEPATHAGWARSVIARARIHGAYHQVEAPEAMFA